MDRVPWIILNCMLIVNRVRAQYWKELWSESFGDALEVALVALVIMHVPHQNIDNVQRRWVTTYLFAVVMVSGMNVFDAKLDMI